MPIMTEEKLREKESALTAIIGRLLQIKSDPEMLQMRKPDTQVHTSLPALRS
jgi:hypothetical protein